jgi:hypothetical protein
MTLSLRTHAARSGIIGKQEQGGPRIAPASDFPSANPLERCNARPHIARHCHFIDYLHPWLVARGALRHKKACVRPGDESVTPSPPRVSGGLDLEEGEQLRQACHNQVGVFHSRHSDGVLRLVTDRAFCGRLCLSLLSPLLFTLLLGFLYSHHAVRQSFSTILFQQAYPPAAPARAYRLRPAIGRRSPLNSNGGVLTGEPSHLYLYESLRIISCSRTAPIEDPLLIDVAIPTLILFSTRRSVSSSFSSSHGSDAWVVHTGAIRHSKATHAISKIAQRREGTEVCE